MIVVSGAAGFIGSGLVQRLLADGEEVLGFDNFISGRRENLGGALSKPKFRLAERDITEPLEVDGPVDGIFHLASIASPIFYWRYPVETLLSGALGTLRMLELAEKKGARLLYTSTSEVYGDPEVHPQTENYRGNVDPVGPRSMYDESKRFAEALVTAFRKRGVSAVIVRIFNTYGPGMRADDGRVVPAFITRALEGGDLEVHGDGSQTRSFCYIDDMIEGLVRAFRSDAEGPLNIGNPEEVTVLELARRTIELAGSSSGIRHVERPSQDPSRRCPDIALIKKSLGWQPRVPLDEGLKRTIEYFRALRA